MTLAELRAVVLRLVGESTVSPEYFTTADVNTAINEGYEEISDASEWYERSATLTLLSHRPYYDLRSVLGSDTFLGLKGIYNNVTGKWLDTTSLWDLDYRTTPQWETVTTGTAEEFWLRGLWWLGLFPQSGSDTGTCKVQYSALPTSMSADSDQPGFPRMFHRGLAEYAAFDLLSQEGETALALEHFKAYAVVEKDLSDWVAGRISTARIAMLYPHV